MNKVIFFIGTLSNGGAERVVSNLSLHMAKNINKKILLFGSSCKVEYPYEGDLVFLDKINEKNIFYKAYALFKRIREIKLLKRKNPKVPVISFLEYPNLINALTRKYGKTILSVRNHMSTKHSKGVKACFWGFTIKHLYSKADLIIAVSQEIKRDLIDNYGLDEKKIKVIYNSYSIDELKELSIEEIEEENKYIFNDPVIVTVGRLNKQKAHDYLIRSFFKIKKEVPNVRLVILGKGGLEKSLKKLANELNIEDYVHFLGFQKNPFKYISKSKIFILSSLHEGFPNALAEAMACKIPIVSTDCLSGPREILAPGEFQKKEIKYEMDKNRYGILLPALGRDKDNEQECLEYKENLMAERVIDLLRNEELCEYFSHRALLRIQDFDINNIIKEWERVIHI